MEDRKNVEEFLKQLKEKIKIFQIAFRNREKNIKALAELDITPMEREVYINSLKVQDYFRGPTPNTEDKKMPDYFEFGIDVKGKETYIKINKGIENKRVDCISFHKAEMKIRYPFKDKKNER